MAYTGYTASTGTAVALVAATAKSVIGVSAPATFGVNLKKYRIGYDGVTATNVPVLIEVCYATFATNGPGTASTSLTVQQAYGRAITAGFTAARNWTTEPTVLTPIDNYTLTPNGGLVIVDIPPSDMPDSAVSNGFVLRMTAPQAVNVQAALWFERA
jgi:hypothetical protein